MIGLALKGGTPLCEASGEPDALVDRELLARFRAGDEAAFAEIVRRHSALVYGVCRRVLCRSGDVDDAFQATFLVLARKAKSLEWRESIAGWLHQTALRTSLKLRGLSARRREVEIRAAEDRSSDADVGSENPVGQASLRELGEILDAELAGLPVRFREVILLSHVEGLTRDEVAARLGISIAAVKDRLERGREQLRLRLSRRGVALASAALAAWLVPGTVQAGALAPLVATTSQAAGLFAAGSWATGTSPAAATLAQGVLHMTALEKLKSTTLWVVSFLTVGGIASAMLRDEPARFEKGLRGQVVAVREGRPSTVTISMDETGTLLNLDVSAEAKVWMAYEAGEFVDLREGQLVSLRLAADHRTVNEIHVQGTVREASVKSIAPSGTLVVVADDDDGEGEGVSTEVQLATDAILRIGGLPAGRDDLRPGMRVPLEFGRDGLRVNAIEAEAAENTLLDGAFVAVDMQGGQLSVDCEPGEDAPGTPDQPVRRTFAVSAETLVMLDGKPAKLTHLPRGASLRMRLTDDGQTVRAITATSPEADDDAPAPEVQ